ncbi:MAG: hypothetical protein GXO86_11550 [Chlorobi bacterium]|nr:hypothetical protein [Chlorobiota bacterium]
MKKFSIFVTMLLLAAFANPVFSQGFQAPSPGKAVVYFVRVSGWGSGVTFEFFLGDKYIGAFKGKNYMRYECDPGENLFWASSENKEFLTADLKAGGIYIVIVDVIEGFWKAHVGLTPVDETKPDLLERAKALVNKKPPVVTPQAKIEKMNNKLKKFISEELSHYEQVTKNKYNFHHISPEMAIPLEKLKD